MLVLPPDRRRLLLAHCAAESPREACGLLLGRRADGQGLVEEALPARNAEAERPRSRFELHPDDLVAGEARARERGWALLGSWHSHPEGSAEPSEADRREAQAGWISLIAGLGGGRPPELRAWRLERGRLVEEALLSRPQ